MRRTTGLPIVALVAIIAAGCATTAGDEELTAKAAASLKASFKPAGQAGLDRLEQDDTQRACSAAAGKPLAKETASKIERCRSGSPGGVLG